MYSKLRLFELKNANFQTKHHFLHKIKVLEVVNFRFLANFRFLTLILTNTSNTSIIPTQSCSPYMVG